MFPNPAETGPDLRPRQVATEVPPSLLAENGGRMHQVLAAVSFFGASRRSSVKGFFSWLNRFCRFNPRKVHQVLIAVSFFGGWLTEAVK